MSSRGHYQVGVHGARHNLNVLCENGLDHIGIGCMSEGHICPLYINLVHYQAHSDCARDPTALNRNASQHRISAGVNIFLRLDFEPDKIR